MFWVMLYLGLALVGLAVLAVCAVKVFTAQRALARELDRTGRRLEPHRAALRSESTRLDRARR